MANCSYLDPRSSAQIRGHFRTGAGHFPASHADVKRPAIEPEPVRGALLDDISLPNYHGLFGK